jgi:TRAP-type C4-dicarboxylate transport system permease small subunit
LKLVVLTVKATVFFFLAILLWVTGTLFHGFLWWSLGLDGVPTILPYMNLAFLPFAFFLSWLVTFQPRRIHCEQCLEAGRSRRHPRERRSRAA